MTPSPTGAGKVPAVEKGCKELLERGVLAGYRIQDVAVEFSHYDMVPGNRQQIVCKAKVAAEEED